MSPRYYEESEPQGSPCGHAGTDCKQTGNTKVLHLSNLVLLIRFSNDSTTCFYSFLVPVSQTAGRYFIWRCVPGSLPVKSVTF